jgi:hypothetical protein
MDRRSEKKRVVEKGKITASTRIVPRNHEKEQGYLRSVKTFPLQNGFSS